MGIKHVWPILSPFCERRPLYELEGKTVAVDLSCWICEAQNIAEYEVQPRMYLRYILQVYTYCLFSEGFFFQKSLLQNMLFATYECDTSICPRR